MAYAFIYSDEAFDLEDIFGPEDAAPTGVEILSGNRVRFTFDPFGPADQLASLVVTFTSAPSLGAFSGAYSHIRVYDVDGNEVARLGRENSWPVTTVPISWDELSPSTSLPTLLRYSNPDIGETVHPGGADAFGYDYEGITNIFSEGNLVLRLTDRDDWAQGGNGDDVIYGGEGNDELVCSRGNDIVYGEAGNDILRAYAVDSNQLFGGAGDDVLYLLGNGPQTADGGSGDDTFQLSTVGELTIVEAAGGGYDTVFARSDFVLTRDAEIELIRTSSSNGTAVINLTGNAFAQQIDGNAADNILHDGGKGGADLLRGYSGNDTYRIFNSGDKIVEGVSQGTADKVVAAVSYALGSGVHIEAMQTNGSTGISAISLTGNAISQSLTGNAGANRLDGKGGADILRGFAGADTFVFTTKLDSGNVDTILDFKPVDDRFLLSDNVFTALTPGTISAAQFRANTTGAAEDADDRIIYDTDSGRVYYDEDGVGGAGGTLFAIVGVGLGLTRLDFAVA